MSSPLREYPISRIVPFEKDVRLFEFDCAGDPFVFLPGQFISVPGANGKSSYFAVASSPGKTDRFEILVKKNVKTFPLGKLSFRILSSTYNFIFNLYLFEITFPSEIDLFRAKKWERRWPFPF